MSVRLGLERWPQPHVGEQSACRRHERLADTRWNIGPAFDHDDAPRRRKVDRRGRPGRTGTDDDNVGFNHTSVFRPNGKRRTLSIRLRSSASLAASAGARVNAAARCAGGTSCTPIIAGKVGSFVGPSRISTTPIWLMLPMKELIWSR